jgi:Fe2+ transport system protein FeoA
LDLLAAGELCEIVATGAVDARCASRAEDMGLHVGTSIQVVTSDPHGLRLKLWDARVVSVDRAMALRIRVRK